MSTQSLADQAVFALARVSEIGEDVPNDHPMRHAIRRMKQTAQKIMSDAALQATEIAYQAKDIKNDFDKSAELSA